MRQPSISGADAPAPGITGPSLSQVSNGPRTYALPALRLARRCAP
jgi:hypothetical protein